MSRVFAGWIAAFCLAGWALGGQALTREQLLKAEPQVREATAELVEALARGEVTPGEAAEQVRIMASQTMSPAEAYLLLQGTFRLYVRAGEYRRVVEVSRHLQMREYSAQMLSTLIEGALEPVPRGVDVGELEGYLQGLREAAARSRKRATERRLARALEAVQLEDFSTAEVGTLPEVLARVRRSFGVPLRLVARCPLPATGGEGFPELPVMKFKSATAAELVSRCASESEFTVRTHGALQLLTRTASLAKGVPLAKSFYSGNSAETVRRLKRIPIGFVAFDDNEPLDEALERLWLAVADHGGSGKMEFDLIMRSEPTGRFPLLKTVRAADTTLYDTLELACRTAGAMFEVRGQCVVVLPAP